MSVVKSAAAILAEIEGAPKPKRERPRAHRRRASADRTEAFNRGPRPSLGLEPRTQATPRDEAWHAEARAYRLAALEMGVHPLMPRDMYRKR